MKNLLKANLFGIAIAMAMALIAPSAKASHEYLVISGIKMVNLGLDQPAVNLIMPYPGPSISGLCGVEIRTDSRLDHPIKKLMEAIEIKADLSSAPVSIRNEMTALIDFSADVGKYTSIFSINSKDGTNLSKTIEKTLGESSNAVLVGVSCP